MFWHFLLPRLLVAKELPSALVELGIEEALEKVIPIMDKLASDPDDTVRETFASELDQTLLFFYKVTALDIYNVCLFTC